MALAVNLPAPGLNRVPLTPAASTSPAQPNTTTAPRPTTTETGDGLGPDATLPSAHGLCTAWSNHVAHSDAAALDSGPMRNLAKTAGGTKKAAAHCASVPHPGKGQYRDKPGKGAEEDKAINGKGKRDKGTTEKEAPKTTHQPSATSKAQPFYSPGNPSPSPSPTHPDAFVTPEDSADGYGQRAHGRAPFMAQRQPTRGRPQRPRRGHVHRTYTLTIHPRPGGVAVNAATNHLGLRHVFGGSSITTGMDCSAFTQWAWAQAGVPIPRTSDTPGAAADRCGRLATRPHPPPLPRRPIRGHSTAAAHRRGAPHRARVTHRPPMVHPRQGRPTRRVDRMQSTPFRSLIWHVAQPSR